MSPVLLHPLVRWFGAAVLLASLSACGTAADAPASEATGTSEERSLSVAVASFDLAVGDDQRLLAAVFTPDRQIVGFGEVTFQLGFLGEETGGQTAIDQTVAAGFLPIPGREPAGASPVPVLLDDPSGQGVYAGRVDLREAGTWGLRVLAEIDGETYEGRTTFLVGEEHEIVDVGDAAPRSVNLTIADVEAGRAEPVAVDSRAQGADPRIPAPHLHDTTVAEALDAGRPVVVVIATPVYCVSQFCGPLTDVLAELALEYQDDVEVIHIEVWEDFEARRLNAAAAEWIQTETGGNEPWVFLVAGDGTVLARWDNVLDVTELRAALDGLPA